MALIGNKTQLQVFGLTTILLVVCQKKEALKVVHQRLDEKQLGQFSALVYDFKNDRKALFYQTLHQIRVAEEHAQTNQGLDDKRIRKEFEQVSKRIDEITEILEEFRWALFDQKESGLFFNLLRIPLKASRILNNS